MKPSWSIFDCRQLVSFRLPLTSKTKPQVTSGTEPDRDGANLQVNPYFAWSGQGFESP
jgi:hypothetical protein